MSDHDERTEIEKIRHYARLSEEIRESLFDNLTRDEIFKLFDMWMASGWDFYPDQWTKMQRRDAIRYGIPPAWDPRTEDPITYEATDEDREALGVESWT